MAVFHLSSETVRSGRLRSALAWMASVLAGLGVVAIVFGPAAWLNAGLMAAFLGALVAFIGFRLPQELDQLSYSIGEEGVRVLRAGSSEEFAGWSELAGFFESSRGFALVDQERRQRVRIPASVATPAAVRQELIRYGLPRLEGGGRMTAPLYLWLLGGAGLAAIVWAKSLSLYLLGVAIIVPLCIEGPRRQGRSGLETFAILVTLAALLVPYGLKQFRGHLSDAAAATAGLAVLLAWLIEAFARRRRRAAGAD